MTFLDNRSGARVSVRVTAYGTKTSEPFVVLAVDGIEAVTSDPTSFFAQVDAAKAAWAKRKGAPAQHSRTLSEADVYDKGGS